MLILTDNNNSYNTDLAAADSNDDIRYCVLDMSVPKEADFYFYPLVFIETFNSPAIVLNIGGYRTVMPYDWFILIGEPGVGELEILPIEDLNDREFKAPALNPLNSFLPRYFPITVEDTYNEVRWCFPKLNPDNILVVPLCNSTSPVCAFFVNEVSGRKLDQISAEILYM